jgi:hypothetical protein
MTVETNGANRAQLAEKYDSLCQSLAEYGNLVSSIQTSPKQQLVDSMEIGKTLADLETTIDRIKEYVDGKNYWMEQLQIAQKTAEEAKALVLISGSIDGKNAEIREAQLIVALKADPEYQQAQQSIETIGRQLEAVNVQLDTMRSWQSFYKVKARLIAAQLEFLAD